MPSSLTLSLQNKTAGDVFAYVTGLALQSGNRRVLLAANGADLYFPANPPAGQILQPLQQDVAVVVAGKTTRKVTIPQIAGGRIWFSRGAKLTFLLNPGGGDGSPALVEPSVLNPADPNAAVDFAFAEFTLNADQLFANISYVDFVPRLPVSLTLRRAGGDADDDAVQVVAGMRAEGLETVCEGLRAQTKKDGRPWDRLIVNGADGTALRVLSPTHGDAVGAAFAGYFEPYVDAVWAKYAAEDVRINTQAAAGVVTGRVRGAELVFTTPSGPEAFAKPSTADILGCNSGPFATGPSAARNAIIPRLAAALQRSTLLAVADQPADATGTAHATGAAYAVDPTNHYGRVVHAANTDGKGYAFAYDDVQPDGGADQSGKVNAGDPAEFVVAVGGE